MVNDKRVKEPQIQELFNRPLKHAPKANLTRSTHAPLVVERRESRTEGKGHITGIQQEFANPQSLDH